MNKKIEKQIDALVIIALCDPDNIDKLPNEIADNVFAKFMDGEYGRDSVEVAVANKRFLDIKQGLLDRLYKDADA
jgi:hypothetical protein